MANIQQYVEQILAARYGEEVRGSIANSILAMNDEAVEAHDVAIDSQESAQRNAQAAALSATNAKDSETKAKASELNAKDSETKAKASEVNAKTSEDNAKASELASKVSETNAKTSEGNAKTSETNAKTSETSANDSMRSALQSASSASASASAASASQTASANSASAAKTSEDNARQYAAQASAVANIDVATVSKNGISRPDGTSIGINQFGVLSAMGLNEHINTNLDDPDGIHGTRIYTVPDTGKQILQKWDDTKSDWVDVAGALDPATKNTIGGVIIGDGIDVDEDGKISAQKVGFATTTEAGIVKVGTGLSIAEDGTLSANVQVYSTINVETSESSFFGKEVTATLIDSAETETVKGTFNSSGKCTLKVYKLGTFRVSTTDSSGTYTQDVYIETYSSKKVIISKFRASILVNVRGGATLKDIANYKIIARGATTYETGYETPDSTGNISIPIGETGTFEVYALPQGSTIASTKVNVTVNDEIQYPASVKFAQLTVKTICETSASWVATNADGAQIIRAEIPSGGEFNNYAVVELGEGRITGTVDGNEVQETFNVTDYQDYTIEISGTPDGKTVTPTDNVQIWLKCAKIIQPYTTISEVLEDTEILTALIADSNAVDYLVRSSTWMSDICSNQYAMTYIGLNNYCAESLLGDSTWFTAICNSTYFEKVLNVKVPTMTSDTKPSGQVIYKGTSSQAFGVTYGYYAFDKSTSSSKYYQNDNTTPIYLGYKFPKAVRIVKAFMVDNASFHNQNPSITIQGSNDGNNWENIHTFTWENNNTETVFQNDKSYQWYRFLANKGNYGSDIFMVLEAQFYGREEV